MRAPDGHVSVARAFAEEVHPAIPALRKRRDALASQFRREAALAALAGGGGTAAALAAGAPIVALLVALSAAGATLVLHTRRRREWSEAALDAVVPPVARALGGLRYAPDGAPEALAPFEALGLVGAARHRILMHRIAGECESMPYNAQHATLARTRGRGRGRRLFHGLVLSATLPRNAPVRIALLPVQGSMSQVFAGVARAMVPPSFSPLKLGDPAFESRYRVLAEGMDAETEARVRSFLSPSLRAALCEIDRDTARASDGRPGLRAAFDGPTLHLAVPRVDRPGWGPFRRERLRPFVDPGSPFSREEIATRLRAMADDLALAQRIVGRLAPN